MRRIKQGELPLHRGTWGGRRPGAGRKPGPNPRIRHLSRETFPAIVEASGREALGRGMMAIAIRFARAVNRALRRRGPVLADRYHLRVLRTPREARNALRYVLLSARRHLAKQLGTRALRVRVLLDPASSARWFDGWRPGAPAVPKHASDAPTVAKAETWLLRVGWRHWGLLDPPEVPGLSRA